MYVVSTTHDFPLTLSVTQCLSNVDADSLTHGDFFWRSWKLWKCRKHTVRCGTPQALLSQIPPTAALIASCLACQGIAQKEHLQQTDFGWATRAHHATPEVFLQERCNICISQKNSNLTKFREWNTQSLIPMSLHTVPPANEASPGTHIS